MTEKAPSAADIQNATSHLYAGAPDARQAGNIRPSRFRPQYRSLTDQEKKLHDAIKLNAGVLEAYYNEILVQPAPDETAAGTARRAHALAMTKLEESIMWAIKALTA